MQGTNGHSATVSAAEDDDEARPGEPVSDKVEPQTEAEKIRALEFMLAGRADEETQIRMARAVKELADHPSAEPRAQLEEALREHQEPPLPGGERPA